MAASRASRGGGAATHAVSLSLLIVLALVACGGGPTGARAAACAPFVYPCACGLCPRIVDCATKPAAECFCGTSAPGTYPHPSDRTKFWMCSHDARSDVRYGVELACPAMLVFDPAAGVCTVPGAVTPAAAAATKSAQLQQKQAQQSQPQQKQLTQPQPQAKPAPAPAVVKERGVSAPK